MLSDDPKQRSWEALAAAAAAETDPEKLGSILEEIFAALEEREKTLSSPPNPSVS